MGASNGGKSILNQKSQKFFTDLTILNYSETIKGFNNELQEKIQLKVILNQIKQNCIYQIQLYNINYNKKNPLNQFTNCANNSDITIYLAESIIINYFFEKEQPLLIEITRIENDIPIMYELRTTLGCIMGSRKNVLQKKIADSENEILILQAEKLKQSEEVINIKFDLKSDTYVLFNDINNKIYYEIFSENLLYRSECLNNEGKFENVKIPLFLFKNNIIVVSFYNCKRNSIGKFKLNIDEFTKGKIFNVKINDISFQIISKSKLTKNYTFVDYLKLGVQIGLSIAIDFTGSNGNPNDINSLHFINGEKPNQYERAIYACGNIVAYYDYDQLFPCFGFGVKINNKPYQIFNLNLRQDPNISYIQGIIEVYHNALQVVELYGPTLFGPIIKTINQMIKNEKNINKYHILMILTDGKIDDIDNTIDELVASSFLPLSVIIIGIGNADFSSMVELDADGKLLINSKGVKASRDIVQFVPFIKYESNPELLANEVLAEIPRQMVEYYEQNEIFD